MKKVYVVSYKEHDERQIIGVCDTLHNAMRQAGEYADEADLTLITKEAIVRRELSGDTVTELETEEGLKIMVEVFQLNAYPIEATPA